jgi:hypothetical protein
MPGQAGLKLNSSWIQARQAQLEIIRTIAIADITSKWKQGNSESSTQKMEVRRAVTNTRATASSIK